MGVDDEAGALSVVRFGGSCRLAAARRIGLEDEAPRRVVRRWSFVKSTDGRCVGSARSRSWVSCSPCIQTMSSPPTIKGIATSSWSRLRIAWCVRRCRCAGAVDRCLRSDVTSAAIRDWCRRERWVGGRGAADRARRGTRSYSHRLDRRRRRGRARRAGRVRRTGAVAGDACTGRHLSGSSGVVGAALDGSSPSQLGGVGLRAGWAHRGSRDWRTSRRQGRRVSPQRVGHRRPRNRARPRRDRHRGSRAWRPRLAKAAGCADRRRRRRAGRGPARLGCRRHQRPVPRPRRRHACRPRNGLCGRVDPGERRRITRRLGTCRRPTAPRSCCWAVRRTLAPTSWTTPPCSPATATACCSSTLAATAPVAVTRCCGAGTATPTCVQQSTTWRRTAT